MLLYNFHTLKKTCKEKFKLKKLTLPIKFKGHFFLINEVIKFLKQYFVFSDSKDIACFSFLNFSSINLVSFSNTIEEGNCTLSFFLLI